MDPDPLGNDEQTYAAVDLGSNSFHMVVARWNAGRLQVIDRIKERVALAAGMRPGGVLDRDAQARALGCLGRFNQRLRPLPAGQVRTLATNTFRRVREPSGFVRRASNVLGHRIEVISGHEEARLIYLGVRYDLGRLGDQLLVIDIGGGSTEFSAGTGSQPAVCESIKMGCVVFSERYFPAGKLRKDNIDRAVLAARQEVEPVRHALKKLDPALIVGSSGTALALEKILVAQGWAESGITRDGLEQLRQYMLRAGDIDELEALEGLSVNRQPVIAGGAAIMLGVLQALEVDQLEVSTAALREGALLDLLDRGGDDDPREATVQGLLTRFGVDSEHAQRVAEAALLLHDKASKAWQLDAESRRFLRWGALLHEMGLAISHNDYHKHGAYLARNADLSGFSRDEQHLLAGLIYNSRRKLREEQMGRSPEDIERNLAPTLLLRLCRHLHRGRKGSAAPPWKPKASRRALALNLPAEWLDEHPLTQADLEAEAKVWSTVGYTLSS